MTLVTRRENGWPETDMRVAFQPLSPLPAVSPCDLATIHLSLHDNPLYWEHL